MVQKILFGFLLFCLVLVVTIEITTEKRRYENNSILKTQKSTKYNVYSSDAKLGDFEIKRSIGYGSFGVVELVKHKADGKLYAMKTIKLEENERAQFSNELIILDTDSPFITNLHYSFKDGEDGFLVFQFVRGGDFSKLSRSYLMMSEQQIRFYIANMVMAIEHLHARDIIHQDLKPSNFLLDDNGYLLLTDFGLSHSINKPCDKFSNCGTQNYMAPEVVRLLENGSKSANFNEAVDWYALGAMMFELVTGKLLLDSKPQTTLFANMRPIQIVLPDTVSEAAKDFLRQLLHNNPKRRLGSDGTESVINHPFFESFDWQRLNKRELKAPYLPTFLETDSTRLEGYAVNE